MNSERQWEYRILYKQVGSVNTSYHYYLATTPQQAINFQDQMIKNKGWVIETLSIEQKNPYSGAWENCNGILNNGN